MQKLQETVVTAAYSVTLPQVMKLSDMAERLGKNKSEVVRMAIDHLYSDLEREQIENQEQQVNA